MDLSVLWQPVVEGFLLLSEKLIGLSKNLKEIVPKIHDLKLKLEEFCVVLSDTNETDSEMQEWLEEVEDMVYDIEDLLDVVDHETKQPVNFSCISVLPMSVKLYYKLSDEVQGITSRIEKMNNRKKEPRGNELRREPFVSTRGPISSESTLFGRESEMEKIIDFLLRHNDGEQRCCIIPIVGMGGVGKTTLAQHAFNDKRVVSSFEVSAWACASMDFDVCRSQMTIITHLTGYCNVDEQSAVQLKLYNELRNKKFLIILDDLWEQKTLQWQQFVAPFVDAAPGSKVIVTTRHSKIADRIKTGENVMLNVLSEDDCWSLFRRHSGLETTMSSRSELVSIGKEISKKCGGLPLAAAVIGPLLRGEEREDKWRNIMNDGSWVAKEGQLEIIPVLKMSYDNLPYSLKCCFSFCTIFTEDCRFSREVVVKLWLSAGLIKGGTNRESLGGDYFDELVSRCLLLRKERIFGEYYVMHDLVRDMGRQVCRGRYMDTLPSSLSWEKARHASTLTIANPIDTKKVFPLRTLRVIGPSISKEDMDTFPLTFRKLRVLSLDTLKIERISKNLCEMRHLRFLRIHGCEKLVEIPAEIGRLSRLSYLHIWCCPQLTQLPSEIGCLTTLSHLFILMCPRLTQLPSEIESLCSLSVLHIGGCLGLTKLPAEIGSLNSLSFLQIWDCPGLTHLPSEIGKLKSLSRLIIWYCDELTQLPSEIGNLKGLSELYISQCPRLTSLPLEIGSLALANLVLSLHLVTLID